MARGVGQRSYRLYRASVLLASVLALSVGALASPAAAQQPCFDKGFWAPSLYPIGVKGATLVVVGDFNEDGKKDVVTGELSGALDILLGTGAGRLGNAVPFRAGTGSWGAMASAGLAADFNADGHLDLAILNHGARTISVLLGDGAGRFRATADYAAGIEPTGPEVGDFNGDGKLDLAASDTYSGTVGVWSGRGDGTFGARRDYAVGLRPHAPKAVDLNGDGRADLIVPNFGERTLSVLLGAAGGLGPRTDTAVVTYPNVLAVADFNGDGHPDVAAASAYERRVSVLLGDGAGGLASQKDFPLINDPSGLAVGDFNEDGHMDIVVSVALGTRTGITELLGTGTGDFTPTTDFPFGMNGQTIAVADLNGDGHQDLVVHSSGIGVMLGVGNGQFEATTDYSIDDPGVKRGPVNVATADFNEDGRPDVAFVDGWDPFVTIALGTEGGGLGTQTEYPLGVDDGAAPLAVTAADFDADGHVDLAVASLYSRTVSVLRGRGDGSFGPSTEYNIGLPAVDVATGDINGDGRLDLIVLGERSDGASAVASLLGTGAGSFTVARVAAVAPYVTSLAAGDLDGDGLADIVVARRGTVVGTVSVQLATGAGDFGPPSEYATGFDPDDVLLADLNEDGRLDLVSANSGADSITVRLGTGTGAFGARADYAAGGYPRGVTVADLNGDGHIDIATSGVATLLGTGTGSFGLREEYRDSWGDHLVAADFTGDGKPDLLVANQHQRPLGLMRNTFGCGTTLNVIPASVRRGSVSGAGAVASSPEGIACGASCSAAFTEGDVVTLTAQPDSKSVFLGWNGAGCAGTAPCVVTMAAAKWVPAVFAPIPAILQLSATSYSVSEAAGAALIPVRRTGDLAAAATVRYSVTAGSATAASDFKPVSGTLTFEAGVVSKGIRVPILDDAAIEPSETVNVALSDPGPGASLGSPAAAVLTITDDDTPPTLSIGDVSIAEGNSGTTTATFVVSLSAAPKGAVTVHFATADGTATAGTDYTALSGTLTFGPDKTVRGIKISIAGDLTAEDDETFTVSLTSPVGATLARVQATGTIVNDDVPLPAPTTEDIVWASASGVAVSGSDLTKTAASGWGNAGAISSRAIQGGDGYVEFVAAEANTGRALGLSNGDSSTGYDDIDFAAFLSADGALMVYEQGVSRGKVGTYAPGDVIRVSVVSGSVRYSRNGAVVYASAQKPKYPLLADAALRHSGATIQHAVISGSLASSTR